MQNALSLGLFGIFGRSQELRDFDTALRSVDLHPKLVPEAVKLTAVKLLKQQAPGGSVQPQTYSAAAEILAYCMIGADGFAGANAPELANAVEQRIETALAAGTSLDAQLVLLALHARVIQPSVVAFFDLESSAEGD
ncbi:MAG TPA: hypothetical protein VEW64_03535 [Methyloceanibacter sp.]|jgi:hypothetical protein|nr:hypothetical protein [Methyloceanibacter sp.]